MKCLLVDKIFELDAQKIQKMHIIRAKWNLCEIVENADNDANI